MHIHHPAVTIPGAPSDYAAMRRFDHHLPDCDVIQMETLHCSEHAPCAPPNLLHCSHASYCVMLFRCV